MEYYEYQPITAEEHAFRLILLHPASQPRVEIDIVHASLDEENLIAYEAISYVWGTQEMGTPVFVPEVQKYLKVTSSLELVLRDLRLPDTKRCLWVDGICINQNDQNDIDKREKNHQVRLMGSIYNSAHRVLFHLGRPTELTPILKDVLTEMQRHQALLKTSEAKTLQDLEQELEQRLQELEELQSLPGVTELQQQQKTQELEEILHQMLERQVPQEPVEALEPKEERTTETIQPDWGQISLIIGERHDDFHTRIRQSVELVLQRPWFRRVWIIQEVANAREALMYWGPTELPVRYFMDLARVLRVKMSTHQKAILDIMPPSRRKGLSMSSGQDLYGLLVRFIGAEASNSHDNIYALLGMCKMGKGHGTLTIDYSKSLESLLHEAVVYMSFCDKSDVPDGLHTMDRLTAGIGSLFQELFVHFMTKSKLSSLRSLLLNRGDQITITPQMIRSTVQNHQGTELLSILLDHLRDTNAVTLDVVEEAIARGNHEMTDCLLKRFKEQSPYMAKWIRASISVTKGFSPLPQYTPLGLAVMQGEAADIGQLLKEGADVNTDMHWPQTLRAGKGDNLLKSELDSRSISEPFLLAATEQKMVGLADICPDGANIEGTHLRFHTALALAVHHGREDVTKILLDHGAKIETKCEDGRTPLSIAAGGGFGGIVSRGRSTYGAEIVQRTTKGRYLGAGFPVLKREKVYSALVQLLLDRGAKVNSIDRFDWSPLWWAVNHGHQLAVEKLLANRAGFGYVNSREMSLLSWAIWNGYENITAQLLANDAQRKVYTHDYLEWAIRADNQPLLQELIDRCALMYGEPFYAFGLTVAIEEGNAAALQTLAQHRMLLRHSSTMSEGLLLAASKGHVKCVEILLEAGSDVDYADSDGNTPLSRAIWHGNRGVVQRLLEKSCSPNGSDRHGYTPIVLAVREGSFDIAQDLLESHANVNARCKSQETALWEAALQGHKDMVRLLLQHGAIVDICADRGTTPLMCACAKGHTAVVEVLLDANADLSIRDEDGRTALDWAKHGDRDQIAQILIARGKLLSKDPEL